MSCGKSIKVKVANGNSSLCFLFWVCESAHTQREGDMLGGYTKCLKKLTLNFYFIRCLCLKLPAREVSLDTFKVLDKNEEFNAMCSCF